MRERIKTLGGAVIGATTPQCSYKNCFFVLAHMRCGSTALSNILCSRPDISGYGEAHISYDGQGALGRLLINQARRKGWSPRARFLFDKILHCRHDGAVTPTFFEARAIFVARSPAAAIRSIRTLYTQLGRDEYVTDKAATEYYVERLLALQSLWSRFQSSNRIGITHQELLADPDATLAKISVALRIQPALENRYISPAASLKGGAGDPLSSGKFTQIQAKILPHEHDTAVDLDIQKPLRRSAEEAYKNFVDMIQES